MIFNLPTEGLDNISAFRESILSMFLIDMAHPLAIHLFPVYEQDCANVHLLKEITHQLF